MKLGDPNVDALKDGRRELRHCLLGLRLSLEKRDLVLFKLVFRAKKKINTLATCRRTSPERDLLLEGHGEDFEVLG